MGRACKMVEFRSAFKILTGIPTGKTLLGRPRCGLYVQNLNCISAFVVKTYILLIEIGSSEGNIKVGGGGALLIFNKSSLMPAPGFSITPLHLTYMTSQYNIYTYTVIPDIIYLQIKIILQRCKNRK